MLRMITISSFALVALSGMASAAEKTCIVQKFKFQFGSDTSTSMNVVDGDKCMINIRPGGTASFEKIEVVKQPKYGTVKFPSKSQFVYFKKASNSSSDEFSVRVTGSGAQLSGPSIISVSVQLK